METDHYCDIEELLLECGLRNTKQKHALIEAIQHNKPFTAAQLLEKLGPRWGNQSTLHRALSQLKEVDFLREVFDDRGETYYEHSYDAHHDHLQCMSCKKYQCVPCAEPNVVSAEGGSAFGGKKAKIISHNLIWRGVCLRCL